MHYSKVYGTQWKWFTWNNVVLNDVTIVEHRKKTPVSYLEKVYESFILGN